MIVANEGWGFTATSRKAHYFRDGRSLCGKWWFRDPRAPLEPDDRPSPDDCVACRRELEHGAGR